MRLSKAEVERRRQAVLKFFRANPTASVAKLNAVLKDGTLTGKPEKMLNIATGYKWRKEATATPEESVQALADALKMPEPPEGLKVESIEPTCEIAVRTGPVALGGCGEDPAKVIAEVEARTTPRQKFYSGDEPEDRE